MRLLKRAAGVGCENRFVVSSCPSSAWARPRLEAPTSTDEAKLRGPSLPSRNLGVRAELITLCDRVLVLCEGRMAGELKRGEVTEERLIELATIIADN